MSQKIYCKILQWGIYVSFLLFLLINNNWLYPYNTPRQIWFNILMEILAVIWLALIVKYPSSRPKLSWLTGGFLAWLVILLITCFTGVDFNLSFWGDANRMMGWFQVAHWFIFYLILITVFTTKADWQKIFNLSLATAVLMVFYSLVKSPETGYDLGSTVNMGNNIGTLGHATHVAGVMLFCFYLALYNFLTSKTVYQKWLYTLAGLITLVGFGYADVSGSQAGLAVSLVVFGLLYTWLAGSKKTKTIGLISIGTFILVIGLLFSYRDAPIFNNRFGKIFRDFSTQNTNLNTRMYAWRSGWQGFLAKPILGWGYGNFNVVYDKFFDGSYYRYTMQEEYFDRAHNNLIDLAATTGVVGLAIYLSIFIFIAYYLIKGYRHQKFGWLEFSIITAIIVGYFIHNLAVFDFWGTYFMFLAVLAWLFWLYQKPTEVVLPVRGQLTNKEILVWLIGGAGALWLIFNYNIAFAKTFIGTIKLTDIVRTTPSDSELLAYYREPFEANTPMDRSGIEVVVDFVDGSTSNLANLSRGAKQEFFDYLIGLNRKVVALNPDNSLNQARLGRTLMMACLTLENKDYCYKSFEPFNKSMVTGGQHITPYRVKSIAQLYLNDVDGAIATLNQALKFYDGYTEVHCQLSRIYLQLKNNEADRALGQDHMKQCVLGGGGKDFEQSEGPLSQEYKNTQEAIKIEAQTKEANLKSDQYIASIKEGLRFKGEGDMGNRDSYYLAIESFKQAAAIADNKVWIPFLNIGNLNKILGDYEQAEINYNKALEISGGDVTVYLAKIELYQLYMKKPPTEVINLYQTALKTVTDNGNLMIGYAAFCRDNGYLDEALKAYQGLAKSFPDNATYKTEITKLQAQFK